MIKKISKINNKKILIIGSNSQIGKDLKKQNKNKFKFIFQNSKQLNYYDKRFEYKITKFNPIIIINLAAFTDVEKAEINKKEAKFLNVVAVKKLCKICKKQNIKLLHISTDYVFNSKKKVIISEHYKPNPQNYYGKTKLMGEKIIINSGISYLIIRTSWVYSEFKTNFVKKIISNYKKNQSLKVVKDEIGKPTSSILIAKSILKMSIIMYNQDIFKDIIHVANKGFVSRYQFAKKIIQIYFKEKKPKIMPVLSKDFKTIAIRSKFSLLDTRKAVKKYKIKINDWDKDLKVILKKIKI